MIFSIDPGTSTGIAVFDGERLFTKTVKRNRNSESFADHVYRIETAANDLCMMYPDHSANSMVYEGGLYMAKRSVKTACLLNEYRGALKSVFRRFSVSCMYPMEWKRAIGLPSNAGKEEIGALYRSNALESQMKMKQDEIDAALMLYAYLSKNDKVESLQSFLSKISDWPE